MSLIGGIIGYCVSKMSYAAMVADRGGELGRGGFWDFVVEFVASAASAMLVIYFGCKTAPRHRRWVYALLVGLISIYNYPSIKSLFVEFHGLVLTGVLGAALGIVAGADTSGCLKKDDEADI